MSALGGGYRRGGQLRSTLAVVCALSFCVDGKEGAEEFLSPALQSSLPSHTCKIGVQSWRVNRDEEGGRGKGRGGEGQLTQQCVDC